MLWKLWARHKDVIIVIDGFKQEIYITHAPAIDVVFDLEKYLVDGFTARVMRKRYRFCHNRHRGCQHYLWLHQQPLLRSDETH